MKRIIPTTLALVLLCWSAHAQAVPATVSFTGRLSTASGPVSGAVTLTFTLFDQALNGNVVWTETRPGTAANAGLVYADLGALTTLDEGVLGNRPLYLEISVGGEILSPRLPLQAVPYAIRSEVANSAELLGTIAPGEVVTRVTAGAGVTVTRSGNGVTVGADPGMLQARVTGTCAANSSIASISPTGAVTCEPDTDTDTNTTYSAAAGGGVSMAGTTFALAPCAAGQVLKAGAVAGSWACGADVDTNTTYTAAAGGGVSIAGTTVGLASCATGQVLKAGAAGTWACAADTDTNTTYSSGSGLTLAGTVLATDNAVVARKDGAAGNQAFDGTTLVLDYANNRVGIDTAAPRERLDVAGPVRLDTMRVFRKYGNNGTTSCAVFCRGANWAGGVGTCLAAKTASGYISCDVAPGLGQDPSCMCAGIDE